MATYTVPDSPVQIVLGGNGSDVAITNKGPSTIFLEDNTSVSTLNGLALPPMAQMTWNNRTPLWAMCSPGASAQILVSDAAGTIDANRSRFWSKIGSEAGSNIFVPSFVYRTATWECGHCNTLLLILQTKDDATGNTLPSDYLVAVTWYDDAGNVIDGDYLRVWNLSVGKANGTISIRIPVVGSQVSFELFRQNAVSGAVTPLNSYTLYGTDRVLPYAYWCGVTSVTPANPTNPIQDLVAFGTGGVFSNLNQVGDGVMFTHTSPYSGKIYLANVGKIIAISIASTGITTAGNRTLIDAESGNVLAQLSPAVGADFNRGTWDVPAKTLLNISNSGGIVGGSMDISVEWRDNL